MRKNQEQNEEAEKQTDPLLKAAKIECTVNMMENIINSDPDSSKLRCLPKFAETFQPHDQVIDEVATKFQGEMKVRHKEKQNTIAYCEQVLRNAEKEAEKESIKLLDAFKSYRKHKSREL